MRTFLTILKMDKIPVFWTLGKTWLSAIADETRRRNSPIIQVKISGIFSELQVLFNLTKSSKINRLSFTKFEIIWSMMSENLWVSLTFFLIFQSTSNGKGTPKNGGVTFREFSLFLNFRCFQREPQILKSLFRTYKQQILMIL